MVRHSLGQDCPAGKSRIVPVKMSEGEKSEAIAECRDGETLSAFIREATRREVARRQKLKNRSSKK
jgi:hypothetical protein